MTIGMLQILGALFGAWLLGYGLGYAFKAFQSITQSAFDFRE